MGKLLENKTAVITGCLSGIGRQTLDTFAENGADVFACVYQETDEFKTHVSELMSSFGVNIIPVVIDMTDNESIKAGAREIQKTKLSPDCLVNIAGINKDALFSMTTADDMAATFQVNFLSQILLSQYIVRLMERGGKGGSIVFTASVAALDGNVGQLSYSASKGALVSATRTMSKELGGKGIRVNAIAPGIINTDMAKAVPEDITKEKIQGTALKRIGEPEEVAKVLLFLASELSSHITGQVIRIDGGMGVI